MSITRSAVMCAAIKWPITRLDPTSNTTARYNQRRLCHVSSRGRPKNGKSSSRTALVSWTTPGRYNPKTPARCRVRVQICTTSEHEGSSLLTPTMSTSPRPTNISPIRIRSGSAGGPPSDSVSDNPDAGGRNNLTANPPSAYPWGWTIGAVVVLNRRVVTGRFYALLRQPRSDQHD